MMTREQAYALTAECGFSSVEVILREPSGETRAYVDIDLAGEPLDVAFAMREAARVLAEKRSK